MRRDAKVDSNQPEIVAALRKLGCSVQPLQAVGDGVPDLLIGYRGKNYCVEVKDGSLSPSRRRLNDLQVKWHANWRGAVCVIESVEEALEWVASLSKGAAA